LAKPADLSVPREVQVSWRVNSHNKRKQPKRKTPGQPKHRHPSFRHWVPVLRPRLVPSPAYSHRYARLHATLVVWFKSPALVNSTRWVMTASDACFAHVKRQCRRCCGCSRPMGTQSPTRSVGNNRNVDKIYRRPLEQLQHVYNMVLFYHSGSNIRGELSYLHGRHLQFVSRGRLERSL
jgi:hypothetical protein